MRRSAAILVAGLLAVSGCASPPQGTVDDPRPSSTAGPGAGTVRPDQPSVSGNVALDWARARIGSPYQWGGTGSNGFDCSGLVQAAYKRMGVRLPRTTRDQARIGQMIAPDAIRPGDLVFFGNSPKSINHVGIASGSGRIVHASSSRGVIEESFEKNSYFRNRYVFARRVTTSAAGGR